MQAGALAADRGDDADKPLASREGPLRAVATSPPKQRRAAQRACDHAAYRARHLIACPIGTRQRSRRSATRADQDARRFRAFPHLASTLIGL